MWADQDFMTTNPIGRPYPYNITCAPVNHAENAVPTTCTLGMSPQYAVNATNLDQINTTMLFAQENNVRLVVTSARRDMVGRSDGFGSLEIRLRHFRDGLGFQEIYASANGCQRTNWTGSAIAIDGAYQWENLNVFSKANNVIVVSGGSTSPGAIGGWPSGGRHGPASRNYGLGADQILEAQVLLANRKVRTANHCEHTDLFTSIRGGGPGYVCSFVTIGRGVALNASNSERFSVMDDMTYVKGAALKRLAPDTGGYMKEGDRNDPDWKTTFYGDRYAEHLATKKKYDP
ncbi:hypothetical protein diail_4575 [Diaporthe ilicicola]|nr:hypothetical protein diail_4575 [Diaporthe ilicicola]